MKKIIMRVGIGYIIYGMGMWFYLFHVAPVGVFEAYSGTVADPATFMTADQLAMSTTFARSRYLMFFLSTPFEWLAICFFIFGGLSQRLESHVTSKMAKGWLQVTVYYFIFATFMFLAMLPFRFIGYQLARFYGTAIMTLPRWLSHRGIDFIVEFVLYLVIIHVILFFIQTFKKRWWVVTWLAFIPFAFFFMLIQPALIDPLYSDFQPIAHPALEARILAMAEAAGVSAHRVFEVKMSDRTNTINAYVTGVGPTARIVLWDTALDQLSEDEMMFLMAHEIAHYVHRDVYRAIIIASVFAFGGLYVVHKVVEKCEKESLAKIPLVLLTVSMLLFVMSPAMNGISRRIEARADLFALALTQDPEAGIGLFQTLSTTALNEVHPPGLVRFFRSTHPSVFERIVMLMDAQ
ncbi:MAG: M48 family metallopeptidase [Defluviitaleaceae bacterium]|nr:M48 family metallopeptidase [Defluviitaleaceae bacterium]